MDEFGGGRGALRLVAMLAAVAGVLLVIWGVRGLIGLFDDIQTIEGPTPAVVALEEGPSTVYYDMDAGVAPPAGLLGARLRITGPDGAEVGTEASDIDFSIETPSRDLVAVLDFDAPSSGEYTFLLNRAETLPPGRLAVGPRFLSGAWRSFAAIVGGAILTIGGIIGALAALRRGTGSTTSAPTPVPTPKGGWGEKTDRPSGWGTQTIDRGDEDDAIWGDAHDWSDEFDETPAAGRDDAWGSGRNEDDDEWRWRDRGDDHDDGMPSPPKSF